ncbi:hypothetical protein K523DRAFT_325195 [Schizophyllum commune Tattone D]|nr:hypothetical protein K523DRAFT_325195 [Schizophyllum commune Tattone D]
MSWGVPPTKATSSASFAGTRLLGAHPIKRLERDLREYILHERSAYDIADLGQDLRQHEHDLRVHGNHHSR